MTGIQAKNQPPPAPAVGFIGWGPESQAMLDALAAPYPGIRDTATVLAARPGELPLTRRAPSLEALFKGADLIFAEGGSAHLAHHLPTIRLAITDRHVLVLLGGGWSMPAVLEVLKERKLARCTLLPAQAGAMRSLAYLVSPYFTAEELEAFRGLFAHLEMCVELKDESHFEVIRGLAEFAPAALYTILEAMADGVVMMGFPRPAALRYLASLLQGAAERILDERTPPALLREQALGVDVAAAGLIEMESAGIRGTMMRAIQRAAGHRRQPALSNTEEKIPSDG